MIGKPTAHEPALLKPKPTTAHLEGQKFEICSPAQPVHALHKMADQLMLARCLPAEPNVTDNSSH